MSQSTDSSKVVLSISSKLELADRWKERLA